VTWGDGLGGVAGLGVVDDDAQLVQAAGGFGKKLGAALGDEHELRVHRGRIARNTERSR
jgi:hypothetical protein